MKKITFSLLFICLIVLTVVISCRKSDRENDTETQSTSDYAMADQFFNDVYKQVYTAGYTDSIMKTSVMPCDTSYVTPAYPNMTFPKTMIIKFDTINGCTGSDGITRKGTIKVVLTGKLRDSLSVTTITFIEYYVNGYKIDGTKTITNKGHNASGNMEFAINVSNASITSTTGKVIKWSSQRLREWTAGESTKSVGDDEYSITGSANGTGIKGNTFTVTINSPLKIAHSCKYIMSGVITLTPANLMPRTIDFGGGTCDALAKVTISGNTYDVTLP